VSDGNGGSDTAQVNITVNAVNDAPMNITGSRDGDTINGGAGNDDLDGHRGNDVVNGNGGNDTIHGGYGNDLLRGGGGNDVLYGDKDNDTLIGGEGSDTLYLTKRAADVAVYEHLTDAGDTVNGFIRGEDKLDLRLLMDDIGYSGSNPAAAGILLFVPVSGGDLRVYVDTDAGGAGAPMLLLTLDNLGSTTLTLGTDYLV
jgi:Ca2+-binding RTX toxin-like protein